MINISGVSDSRAAPVIAQIIEKEQGQTLIIVSSELRAERLKTDLSFFVSEKECGEIIALPGLEESIFRFDAKNHDLLFQTVRSIEKIALDKRCVVIAPVMSAVRKLMPRDEFFRHCIHLEFGCDQDPDEVKMRLSEMGYVREYSVTEKGQFAVRGDIIDVFPPQRELPLRIEFFDTEVDSVREFSPKSQLSVGNLKEADIFPSDLLVRDEEVFSGAASKIEKNYRKSIKKAGDDEEKKEALSYRMEELLEYIREGENLQQLVNLISYFYDEPETLLDYMPDAAVVVDDPDNTLHVCEEGVRDISERLEMLLESGKAVPEDKKSLPEVKDYLRMYSGEKRTWLITPFQKTVRHVDRYDEIRNVLSRQTPPFDGRPEMFIRTLKEYIRDDYDIQIVCSSDERLSNMREFLEHNGIEGKIFLRRGRISAGIDYPEEKRCWITDADIFSGTKKRRRKRQAHSDNLEVIKSFSDIKTGDYVVHENYGIGVFEGIEERLVSGTRKDCLKIIYKSGDCLFVPVEHMDFVQKYVGSESLAPAVNSLSGGEWKKKKAKARIAVEEMARELLKLSAERKAKPGYSFGPDTNWQTEFESEFPFVETDDQLRAVDEIKEDMESSIAMDRMLCGDVGFGKTEVAARALFKCAAEGKQAVLLVPTTILANQHYYTLKDRFEKFPVNIEVVSRFKTKGQQKKIIDGLKSGRVDVVIGTHRLLSKDVEFKDLGLLVIDEEQRFGVAHKERIKKMKTNVDVLTLSATPIPRTLHMSLIGIKNLSVLEEPPSDRYPVQTYLMEQDDRMIKDAIEREISRGGQVFVVYNRVRGLNRIADRIEELVPDARVCVGHGQMNERMLEDIILDFIDGKTNVLVATTIIESGVDIPNVNTMIVLDADRYGLSQLYQLRGRVGRGKRLAYAYLMYKRDKSISETADKRLKAIRDFTEFGAGFKVAMRDLEIRGAGSLLGSSQHGHMIDVGYEMYCRLVEDAVKKLQGETVPDERVQASIEVNATAYIPDSYISEETLKLQMYRRIAGISGPEERDSIEEELTDRFGDIPYQTRNLISVSVIKALCEKCGVYSVVQKGKRVEFRSLPEGGVRPENLAEAAAVFGPRIFIHGGVKPVIRYTFESSRYLDEIEKVLMIFAMKLEANK